MVVFNDLFHIFLNKGGRLVGQEHLADGSAVEIHLIAKFLHHLYVVGTVHLFDHKPLVGLRGSPDRNPPRSWQKGRTGEDGRHPVNGSRWQRPFPEGSAQAPDGMYVTARRGSHIFFHRRSGGSGAQCWEADRWPPPVPQWNSCGSFPSVPPGSQWMRRRLWIIFRHRPYLLPLWLILPEPEKRLPLRPQRVLPGEQFRGPVLRLSVPQHFFLPRPCIFRVPA